MSAPALIHNPTFMEARQRAVRAMLEAGWEMGEAQREARMMLTMVSGATREEQVAEPARALTQAEDARFEQLLQRRLMREPMAYLAGSREFYGRDFLVSPATLIPRPDSETLVEAVLADLPENIPARILDMGTGTGCLLLTILSERILATGLGTDLREDALELAQRNADLLSLSHRAGFKAGSWWDALQMPHQASPRLRGEVGGGKTFDASEPVFLPPQSPRLATRSPASGGGSHLTFDIILSNPPYISTEDMRGLMPDVAEYEPHSALFGGEDGLEAYRTILSGAAAYLAPQGNIYFEIGLGQGADIAAFAAMQGFACTKTYRDLGGIERVLVLQKTDA